MNHQHLIIADTSSEFLFQVNKYLDDGYQIVHPTFNIKDRFIEYNEGNEKRWSQYTTVVQKQ